MGRRGRLAHDMTSGTTLFTRRAAIAALASSAAVATAPKSVLAAGLGTGRTDSLGAIAAEKGVVFGASFAVHETAKPQGARYAQLYAREVRSITSELELKMSSLRPAEHILSFDAADGLFDFAATHALAVRGHTLVWNDDVPPWIKALSTKEAGYLMDAHIEAVLERYRGRAAVWDVVNEPIAPWDNRPDNLRAGPFLAAYGIDYIARSFERARRFEPNAKLVLNEAFTETADERGETYRRTLLSILKRLKDQAAPVDAVGLQCHLSSRHPYDFPRFAAFLHEIAALGFEIHLTELDVDDSAFPRLASARDARVAALYRDFLTAALSNTAVTSVTTWQLADHTSWMHYRAVSANADATTAPRPLPFDADFNRKPAWMAIANAFRAMPPR